MLIDYRITERDYVRGELQVYRPGLAGNDMPKILMLSLAGVLCTALAASDFLRSGFAWPEACLLLLGLSLPFCSPLVMAVLFRSMRKHARLVYRNTSWLRGRLLLDVNEEGAEFNFEGHSMKTSWPEFTKFFEDRRTFIIHQRNPQSPPPLLFHIIPKHSLSSDQIAGLRQYLQSNVGKKTRGADRLR